MWVLLCGAIRQCSDPQLAFLPRKNMYSGGENLQMNGDTPHDGGHGGGGHGDCEELQRTGRSVSCTCRDPAKGQRFLPEPFWPFHFPSQHAVCIG